MRRALKVLGIALLSLLGAAVLLSGIFLLSVKLSFDDMNEKTYYEYVFDIPDSENKLVVKEYFSFRDSGIEFYLETNGKEKLLNSVTTNEYLPFGSNDYSILWRDKDTVDIRYGFGNSVRKTVTLELNG